MSSYQPEVSDISDNELVDSVEMAEKSLSKSAPSRFDIFRTAVWGRTCKTTPLSKTGEKPVINPARSNEDMTELGKKRLVC